MAYQPRTLIVINKIAARARRAWPTIDANLKANEVTFEAYFTTRAGDATSKTRAALKLGYDTIAVVGGDGTLSEAAAGFFEFDERIDATDNRFPVPINPNAALAILPAGTGDDFARGLMGKRAPLEKWLETLVSHCKPKAEVTTRVVDVIYGRADGYTRPFICVNASTLGIGGETAARVATQGNLMRRFSGEARFLAAAIGALVSWRERRVCVLVDETAVIDCAMNLVAIANGVYAGGGMMFAPKAEIDDGRLDVLTAYGLTRAAVIRELPRIHTGGHLGNPRVRVTRGRSVRVETFTLEDALLIEADGNLRGRTPADFRILPRALRIVFRQ